MSDQIQLLVAKPCVSNVSQPNVKYAQTNKCTNKSTSIIIIWPMTNPNLVISFLYYFAQRLHVTECFRSIVRIKFINLEAKKAWTDSWGSCEDIISSCKMTPLDAINTKSTLQLIPVNKPFLLDISFRLTKWENICVQDLPTDTYHV